MQDLLDTKEEFENTSKIVYYFSNFKLFENDIVRELCFWAKFHQSIIKQLGEEWIELAGQTAYILKNNEKIYVTSRFILDTFVYSWMNSNQNHQNYYKNLDEKLSTFLIEEEHIDPLKKAFLICAQEIQQESENVNIHMSSFNAVLTPLLVLKEKAQLTDSPQKKKKVKYEDQLGELVERLTLDEVQTPIKNYSDNRSQSDFQMKELLTRSQKSKKIEKLQKKQRKAETLIGIPDTIEKQKWQTIKQMVVMIWEVDDQQEERRIEKIRFIQPAQKFYSMCLKLWVYVKSSYNNKLNFNQFSSKVKHYFGKCWNDRYLMALHKFFSLIEQTLEKITKGGQNLSQLELITHILNEFFDEFSTLWQTSIIDPAAKEANRL